ncbi:coniferyl aldehyde dehydrogenase [Paracoccus cavernae]|uniref:Aldehyde dehydrogenase n=1 Tax=Paracoccus cavernae TaxID=1571207 RepID=A0ABT8D9F2_9RHOB|nr:coniferyl aldehyde dehydrogenase [Paracoccus cavernae]
MPDPAPNMHEDSPPATAQGQAATGAASSDTALRAAFDALFQASRADPLPDWPRRRARLLALKTMIRRNRTVFGAAIARDFGQRPQAETDMAEIFPSLQEIRHALRHGKGWMRRRKAGVSLPFLPARAAIHPRPVGLVGIVAPWNYPLFLAIGPLVSAFVAGNRAMVKLSEHAPAFAEAFATAATAHFDAQTLAVVTGGPEVAAPFTALPFDHLVFTGSTAIGHHVMAAAAANLTPLTLELGGKSPALVAPDADLDQAVAAIMRGKLLNAGQTCIAPDYVLVPRARQDDFIVAAKAWVARHYPALAGNPDYSHIINPAQFARLDRALQAALAKGASAHALSDAAPDAARRLMPPLIVLDAQGPLAEEEIFGPILPLVPYDHLREAVAHITARPRPLAFYPFTRDPETRALLLAHVTAGGVSVNDTLFHIAQPGLPFGGIGASGMGAYHGKAGFERLSHLMPVFEQAKMNGAGLLAPPYRHRFRNLMRLLMR